MNHKTYRVPAKDFAMSEEGKGTVVFATLGVVDKDGDITYKNAFGNSQVAHLLPMHVWKDADSPFLGIAKIREEGDKAIADIEINMDTQRGRDWRSSLKFALERGKDIEWSYGYDVEDSDNPTIDGKKRRGLKSITVHELSPVVIGAGEETRTLSMKGYSGLRGTWESMQEAIRFAATSLLLGDRDGWVSIEGTYDSSVVVCAYSYDGDFPTRHYEFDWSANEDGTVALSNQREVDLQTIVTEKNLKLSDLYARLLGEISLYAYRSKAAAAARVKEGRTLSRANRDRLTRLVADLSGLLAETDTESVPAEETQDEGKILNLDGLELEFLEMEAKLEGVLH